MRVENTFRIKSYDDFKEYLVEQSIDLPLSEDTHVLARPVLLAKRKLSNAIGIHPLEGFDGTEDGRPDELTFRRYRRYGASGAGLLWFEACAVCLEGRLNPRQLWLREETVESFRELLRVTHESAKKSRGEDFKPYTVLQLTHSGRESRDTQWADKPMAAVYNPYIDGPEEDKHVTYVTDAYLEELEDIYVNCARLAHTAGFDSVDIKACHGYLIRELLSAVTRKGKYGGSFENRTRFLLNIVRKIRAELGDSIDISVRLNAYDGSPWPYGWGMDPESKEGELRPDYSEPIALIRLLVENGVSLINVSAMDVEISPYGRGRALKRDSEATVQAAKGVFELLKATHAFKKAVPEAVFMATGLSWFREFGVNAAAGGIEEGWFDIAGFGRQAFAYPSFASDMLDKGMLERQHCCIACGKCFELMSGHERSGCVVRDPEVYVPIYRRGKENREKKENFFNV